ncbi:MAG TPA: tetratricopeptide repeat protein [Gemmatimonadales bacterium]|nr:tetratricopeptide repeat protein [Gemmatimonadales bacterium]
MALSEIEKLERRYAENPQGLTFAPLAEVHRKNGDVARALELLRPGLTVHPDYIPASIVLGRCHLDLGELPAAEAAFNHVLSLDAENVIALKALADIAERMFRFDDAERALNALLAVDRSNDEARDQLSRVDAARQQAEAGASVAPETLEAAPDVEPPPTPREEPASAEAAAHEPAAAEPAPLETIEVAEEAGLDWTADVAGAEPEEPAPLELEELESVDMDATEPPPEGIQLEQPVTLEDDVEPVEPIVGLVGREEDLSESPLPAFGGDFRVETAEDIVLESSGSREFQMASAAEELLVERAPEPEPVGPAVEAPAEEPVAAQPAADEPRTDESLAEAPLVEAPVAAEVTAEAVSADEPRDIEAPGPEPTPPPEPDLVITESMAELLLQQGYRAEALTVYRHLESRSPGDLRLLQKISELDAAPSEPAPLEVEQPSPAWSVAVTRGRPVREFLGAILAARPPAVAAGPAVHSEPARGSGGDAEGAPTRPAHDSLSLSSVFGEESAPNPPAVPAAGAGASAQSGVSYDEFFGAAGAPTAARPPRTPDSTSDDLDQFHAWLQNLKR